MMWQLGGMYIYDHNAHSLDYASRIYDIQKEREDFHANRNFGFSKNWSPVKSAPIKICNKVWIGCSSWSYCN